MHLVSLISVMNGYGFHLGPNWASTNYLQSQHGPHMVINDGLAESDRNCIEVEKLFSETRGIG